MNRTIVYPAQNPLETDILNANKDAYLAVSKVMESVIGANSAAAGLSCVPTTPASLNVVVKPGCVYQMQALDATAYSTLGTDAHSVLKQGISLDDVQLSCPAPSTAGYSVNYLIQAQVLESDAGDAVLPYYNSANPNVSFNGPSNTGTSQKTRRLDACNITVKTGVAAPSGSQTTPAADSGFLPLYVVTVAYAQTAITSGGIAQHGSAVIIPSLLDVSTKANAALPATSYTAADVLAKLKTVDGNGSGLDADTLDGHDSSYFATASAFAGSMGDSGSYSLPGGFIVQWGTVANAGTLTTASFNSAFPTACFQVFISAKGAATFPCSAYARPLSASQFQYASQNVDSNNLAWFAIGN